MNRKIVVVLALLALVVGMTAVLAFAHGDMPDVIVIDNTVWYTASPAMLEGNFKEGRDLRTGKVVKTINGPDIKSDGLIVFDYVFEGLFLVLKGFCNPCLPT